MTKMFIRMRFDDVKVIEIDPSTIRGFKIDEENGEYYLALFTDVTEFIIEHGSSDHCHAKLTKLHIALDCHFLDIQ